jgi:recombination protein RecR
VELPKKLQQAVDQLSKIPGIGGKTAMRQALQLAKWNEQELTDFSLGVKALGELQNCVTCGMYSDDDKCTICSNPKRQNSGILCVVENVTDCLAIERSEKYYGAYHVLGGVLNPLMGIGPDDLNIDSLVSRVEQDEFKTIILAVNPSVEGDATCSYLRQLLPEEVNVDRIGFGIPMGGSLEYVDSMTISKAIENRRKL